LNQAANYLTSIDELIAAAEAAAEEDDQDDNDQGTCQDTDNGAVDTYGDGCDAYT
jgi:hypothetical protein